MSRLKVVLLATLLAMGGASCDQPAFAGGFNVATAQFGVTTPAFTPLSITGCKAWLRSDLGITLNVTKVSAWADQSGNSNSATATGTNQPGYTASGGLNGNAFLTFDTGGVTSIMSWTMDQTGARTVVVVLKPAALPHTGFSVYTINHASGTTHSEMLLDNSGYADVSFVDEFGSGNMSGYSGTLTAGGGSILLHTYNGSGSGTAANYTASDTGTTKTVVASGAYGSSESSEIGARASTFAFRGDIYEIIYYNSVLSGPNQASLIAYERARYGL